MSEDPQVLGQRLKAERERRGMSTQKIANGMHLDEWVIDALEAGDYQRIGPSVYAKGHLKKYASLLGVSAAPPADPVPPAAAAGAYPPPIVRLDTPRESHAAWPRIGTVAAVAILAGGVFWWREAHQGSSAPAAPVPPPPQVVASTGTSAEEAPAEKRGGDSAEEAPAMPAKPSSQTALPAAASSSTEGLTPGVGKARLRLSFSEDSWVDIRDYSGKRVFQGNGRANSVKTVAGMAPFRVYLRSAGGVQLQLNDRAVAIGRQFISGDEARFEAGADGVLRREPAAAPGNGPETAAVSPHG
ncbi:MAG TPA: RodZ domain-containing protein [Steroidobacteraceae bacterium]|jgi:cytoskeleton protein RodZ